MPSSYEYGNIFENFIVGEIFKLNSYYEKDYRLSYVKTKDGVEIDLVIECGSRKVICVEIKSGRVASLDGFKAQIDLAGDIGCPGLVVLSQNVKAMAGNGITVFPWKEGIRHIFER